MTEVLPDAQKEALNQRIPAGRMGEGSDIAAAVVYLASRAAGYVTGQTIHVNGGMAMLSLERPTPRTSPGRRIPRNSRARSVGCPDRTSVVSGKSVSVRFDLGGLRLIKKNQNLTQYSIFI